MEKNRKIFMPWALSLPLGLIILAAGYILALSTMFAGCNRVVVGTSTLPGMEPGRHEMFAFQARRFHNYRFIWSIEGVEPDLMTETLAGARFSGRVDWDCDNGWSGGRKFDLDPLEEPDEEWPGMIIISPRIVYYIGWRAFSPSDQSCRAWVTIDQATQHFNGNKPMLSAFEEAPRDFIERIANEYVSPILMVLGGLLGAFGLAWIVRGAVIVLKSRKTENVAGANGP